MHSSSMPARGQETHGRSLLVLTTGMQSVMKDKGCCKNAPPLVYAQPQVSGILCRLLCGSTCDSALQNRDALSQSEAMVWDATPAHWVACPCWTCAETSQSLETFHALLQHASQSAENAWQIIACQQQVCHQSWRMDLASCCKIAPPLVHAQPQVSGVVCRLPCGSTCHLSLQNGDAMSQSEAMLWHAIPAHGVACPCWTCAESSESLDTFHAHVQHARARAMHGRSWLVLTTVTQSVKEEESCIRCKIAPPLVYAQPQVSGIVCRLRQHMRFISPKWTRTVPIRGHGLACNPCPLGGKSMLHLC